MRKILALVLAIVMLSTMAISASATTNMEVDVRTNTSTYGAKSETGNVNTELWLQVDAEGQIDVTVPLVIVFKTDIDGGNANTATNYKITNNSTADLAVTKIDVTNANNNTANATNPMTQVAYTTTDLAEDQFKAQLSVNADSWDLLNDHEKARKEGGLFQIKQPDSNNADANETTIDVAMTTGKLSFVTSRNENDELDTTKGVKLLNICYTVAINTANAIGAEIPTVDETLPASGT